MTSEKIDKKILQVVNLSPSESWVEKIEYVHPMKQITIASIVQITMFGLMFLSFLGISNLFADEMVHQFKNPSFSGVGTSAHYLTIENQEFSRKMSIKEELKAIQEQIERDKENTTLARFIRNLESRIYAQLSRQLVENLFGETPSENGTLTLEGNTITYSVEDGIITLVITDSNGDQTTIQLPIGNFTF
jgi:hypothetical protein|tara:strand:+ start:113 stop:682 length:570 start_codon:yes stop_codon:yes gene_type:complete